MFVSFGAEGEIALSTLIRRKTTSSCAVTMATFMLRFSVLILAIAVTNVFCGQIIMSKKHRYQYKTWPALQGEPVEVAAAVIHKEYPEFTIKVRSAKDGITSEILQNTVFLYEDEEGKVVNQPESVEEVPIEITIWPELVGKEVEEAKEVILKDKPDAQIQTLPSANSGADDVESDRVRIFVDSHDLVVETPRSG